MAGVELMTMRDELINHVLDLEADGRTSAARALAAKAAERDPAFADELRETRASLADLTAPAWTPDLSEQVLWAVEARRPFLPRRSVRRMAGTRMALACGMLAALMVAGVLRRVTMTPSTSLVESGDLANVDAINGAEDARPPTLAAGVWSGGVSPDTGIVETEQPRSSLSLGDISKYGLAHNGESGLNANASLTISPTTILGTDAAAMARGAQSSAAQPLRIARGTSDGQADGQAGIPSALLRPALLSSTNARPVTSIVPTSPMDALRLDVGLPQWTWPGLINTQFLLREGVHPKNRSELAPSVPASTRRISPSAAQPSNATPAPSGVSNDR